MTTRSIDASGSTRGIGDAPADAAQTPTPHGRAQTLLNRFYSRPRLSEHGRDDAATREAIEDFQRVRGLPVTGSPDPDTLDELDRAIAWQRHEAEASAPGDGSPSVPETRAHSRFARPAGDESVARAGILLSGETQGFSLHHLSLQGTDTIGDRLDLRGMTNPQLLRFAARKSNEFDAEPEAPRRRELARVLMSTERELARRIARAPRDATELPVLEGVDWSEGSPNAGLPGDLHPFQNHDLWAAEVARTPRRRRGAPRGDAPSPPAEARTEGTRNPASGSAREAAAAPSADVDVRGIAADGAALPAVPDPDGIQAELTVASGAVSLANVAIGAASLVGGEVLLFVAGTVDALLTAGETREKRILIRSFGTACQYPDPIALQNGRVTTAAVLNVIRTKRDLRMSGMDAGGDAHARRETGLREGASRAARMFNEALSKLDEKIAALSPEERARVDVDAARREVMRDVAAEALSILAERQPSNLVRDGR